MARLNYDEAAHRVRMTPTLLKWCTKYAPRRDGMKLAFAPDGTIDEQDLTSFDAHLRADWGDKYVPTGILEELKREALGRCATCPDTQPLDGAHVNRRKHEALHYYQHPHNLLLMCKNCHGRYDSMKDPTLTHAVISHRKGVLQSGLLEAIDREIHAAREVEKLIAPFRASLAFAGSLSFWSGAPGAAAYQQLSMLSGSLGAPVPTPSTGAQRLLALSSALAPQYPLAAAKVASLFDGLGTDTETWEHLDDGEQETWLCSRGDGAIAMVESARCPNCDEETGECYNEEPVAVERQGDLLVAYFHDGHDDTYTPSCPSCGNSPLDFTFQSLCGYCEHMTGKND